MSRLGKTLPQLHVIWPPGKPRLDPPPKPSRPGGGGGGGWGTTMDGWINESLFPFGAEMRGGGRGINIEAEEGMLRPARKDC